MLEDRCVCCGIYVPEGFMICPLCEDEISNVKPARKTKEEHEADRTNILNYLKKEHKGKENAVFSKELEELCGIGDRDVRRHISALRKEGKPICSDFHKGYYYADSQDDVNDTVLGLSDYVSGLLESVTGLRTSKVKDSQGIKITITIEHGDDEEDGEDGAPALVLC